MAKANYIIEGLEMTIRSGRAAMFKCYPHKCLYCQTPASSETLTMDHLIPISKGGLTTIENIVPACLDCNQAKSDSLPSIANCILASEWLRIPIKAETPRRGTPRAIKKPSPNPKSFEKFHSEFLSGAFLQTTRTQ